MQTLKPCAERDAVPVDGGPVHVEHGEPRTAPIPYAGIPWYSTTFGRDGADRRHPDAVVRSDNRQGGTQQLAAYQATKYDPELRPSRGKSCMRSARGEMAALKEVPFGLLLWFGRFDAAVLGLARHVRRADGRLRPRCAPFGRPPKGRWSGWRGPGTLDGDGFLEYRGTGEAPSMGCAIRDGRIRSTRSSTPMASSPRALSRSARSKVTPTPQSATPRSLRSRSGDTTSAPKTGL